MLKSYSERTKGILALVILTAMFASMGVFARYLNTGFVLLQQVYLRVVVAFLLSLLVLRKNLQFSKLSKIPTREWLVLAFRAITMYLAVTLFSQSVLSAKLGNISFISSLPFVALFGIIFFKEKLTWQKLALIMVGLVGVTIIAVRDYTQALIWGHGEILALVAAIFFALSYVSRKWHSSLLNNQEMSVIIFAIASVILFITSLAIGDGLPLMHWSASLIGVVLLAALFNVIGIFLVNYGFERIDNVLAGNILTLEVVFGVLLGFIFYGEVLSPKEWLGGLLIVLSVIGMNHVSREYKISR